MMTNNTLLNINRNKNNLSKLDQQYASGKKIQRPSEDPITAVRALRLRANLAELDQYYERNIPDAMSWMEVTESALKNINTIMTSMNESCVQGASDPLTVEDRESIVKTLNELKEHIYQEGNSTYAGRYVFTGYKTDTSLMFEEPTTLEYDITEKFGGNSIDIINKVINNYAVNETPSATKTPETVQAYRIRLAYENLEVPLDGGGNPDQAVLNSMIKINGVDIGPNPPGMANVTSVSATDNTAYSPGPDDVHFIAETGELILGANVYNAMKDLPSDQITVDYGKDTFSKGDLRPEHYFDCTTTQSNGNTITYTKEDQPIRYEINFGQKLTINTQASDTILHAYGRDIEEILNAVQDVSDTEKKIAEVDKLLEDSLITDAKRTELLELKDKMQTELTLKNKVMHDAFELGIEKTKNHQNTVNVSVSDLGSRYNRLELTQDRLSSQQVEYTDLLSTNEDADLVDTFVKLSSAEALYTASLSSASKVIRNSLLDFL